MKKIFSTIICLSILMTFITVVKAENIDITETGIDFITSQPAETTVYTAGSGTLTYSPATETEPAIITLNNATINGAVENVSYWSNNKETAAILAKDDVNLVLEGDNNINITNQYAGGMFFYDSNLNISGNGNLTIDSTKLSSTTFLKDMLIKVLGKYGNEDFNNKESGNVVIDSGNITLSALPGRARQCLNIHHNFTMNGGILTVNGGKSSIYTVMGDMNIQGGKIYSNQSTSNGLYSKDGNITLSNNSVLEITGKDSYKFGINTGNKSYSQDEWVYTKGDITIDNATVNITDAYVGMYTPYGGNVNIISGNVTCDAFYCGIYSEGDFTMDNGILNIKELEDVMNGGIYATNLTINDGKVDVSANDPSGSEDVYGLCSDNGTIQINGGDISIHTSSADTVKNYSITSPTIDINSGILKIQSSGQSFGTAPNIDDYSNAVVVAGTDIDGTVTEEYIPENISSYKYFNIFPKGYSVKYENGVAKISSEQAVNDVSVIFAAYNENKQLIDCEIKPFNLRACSDNIVTPDNFDPQDGTVKVMVWNSLDTIEPLF